MNKKGFTLIELLAVIIILGIIALICFVSVNSVLKDSKGSLKDIQIKNIEKAAEAYYVKEGMPTNTSCIEVSNLINLGYIEGESIKNPENKEQMNGSVKIRYSGNKYSYQYQSESCEVICRAVTQKTTGNIPSGNYDLGDEYICDVNDTDSYTFFVLSKNDDGTVNLIMDRNITSDGTPATASNPGTVQWINKSDYTGTVAWDYTVNGDAKSGNNSKGPVTAMKYLIQATSSWANIDKYNYNFEVKNIAVNSVKDYTNQFEPYGTSGYPNTSYSNGSYTFQYESKARLILVEEAFLAGCKFESSDKTPNKACPLWLSNYLYYRDFRTGASSYLGEIPTGVTSIENSNIRGYWALNGNGNSGDQNVAFEIYDHININSTTVDRENYNGVRPVITLSKSKLSE